MSSREISWKNSNLKKFYSSLLDQPNQSNYQQTQSEAKVM
jgi:hypothetical protein